MSFDILTEIARIQTIAAGAGIRELRRLRRRYGKGRWRKRKGFASVRLGDGTIWFVELHWYEAHGIGKKEIKIKRLLQEEHPRQ
jgi:hypothetical protein